MRHMKARKSIVIDGSGCPGEFVYGTYSVTHESPGRSEHWITDENGDRHLIYRHTLVATEEK